MHCTTESILELGFCHLLLHSTNADDVCFEMQAIKLSEAILTTERRPSVDTSSLDERMRHTIATGLRSCVSVAERGLDSSQSKLGKVRLHRPNITRGTLISLYMTDEVLRMIHDHLFFNAK